MERIKEKRKSVKKSIKKSINNQRKKQEAKKNWNFTTGNYIDCQSVTQQRAHHEQTSVKYPQTDAWYSLSFIYVNFQ